MTQSATKRPKKKSKASITIRGARQNNLRNIDLDLPLNELIVVTGVSGSGKSSLAFDTIYSEGQRRYIETFSAYARQFLDRMDKPQVDRIDGIPPAIAIDQANPVRTSRSTVGTMTELNDHLKLLFSRVADLYCHQCGELIRKDSPISVVNQVYDYVAAAQMDAARAIVSFIVKVPENFQTEEVGEYLSRQGYTRITEVDKQRLRVVQDRFRITEENRSRAIEACDAAIRVGKGDVTIHLGDTNPVELSYSSRLHCADCDIEYTLAVPNTFSFNSPVGACEGCRGFGRTMGIDYDLVIPDHRLSLEDGAIRPFQSRTYKKFQTELIRHARERGLDTAIPWGELGEEDRRYVIDGEGTRRQKKWFGLTRFFAWLERKSYRMHIRVLLAKYRSYDTCAACNGSRLKPEALLWKLQFTKERKLNVQELMQLPLADVLNYFECLAIPDRIAVALDQLLREIRLRLSYLNEVGLGYLTLDRQSRTLSGGEVQRINLTTALGTSLVNTLFVLDEPSIGLHARDIQRLVSVLQRLRDAGNTLLVVEHDAQIMLAADRVIDVGPGPGRKGGQVVFNGTPAALLRRRDNLTAAYLSGKKQLSTQRSDRDSLKSGVGASSTALDDQSFIVVRGARQHNLKSIDVHFPLGGLVAVTGVSGSGKSTLVHDTLYKAVARLKGHSVDAPGEFDGIDGADLIGAIELVDQTPIGKTTRSNPASYVGAFEVIRKVFAAEAVSRERGYSPGTFSFNTGNGRCPTCAGNGFEKIEMQFLSDVYLRCPTCNGKRFRGEILDVAYAPRAGVPPLDIAQVLELSVSEALEFFSENAEICARLSPLVGVGLDYLALGQSVPTLSGGEAQRLKLAAYIAKSRKSRKSGFGTLFLFDEPTTGLHFSDIDKLHEAFRELIAAGHSVVIVEHNLDLIRVSDWIIDLGPEGGDAGGEIVAIGTPKEIIKNAKGPTADALRHYESSETAVSDSQSSVNSKRRYRKSTNEISIVHAREHNLRNIDVSIPRDQMTAITGVSGSGKSTIAFDILFAEGQRRYLESLNAYARQFAEPASRADVDAVHGIPPTVAIEQRTSRGGRKSTVATVTEIYHYLRLLFVKLGEQHCPDCGEAIEAQLPAEIVADIAKRYRGKRITIMSPLVIGRKGYYTDLAGWAAKKGFDELVVDGQSTPTNNWPRLDRYKEHDIDLPIATFEVKAGSAGLIESHLATAIGYGKGLVRVRIAAAKSQIAERLYSTERACASCSRSFEPLDPRMFSFNSKRGWCPDCYGTGQKLPGFDEESSGEDARWLDSDKDRIASCGSCGGERLRAESLAVQFDDRSITDMAQMTIDEAYEYFNKLALRGRAAAISEDIRPELLSRLKFLKHVGLGYLSLNRAAPTLSGGEAQRIRLAAQLGSNLRGVCYILDEPTIGLHARDNARLLNTLDELAGRGNTVVVVEHDEDTIRRADHIIDVGPGAGRFGGEIVVAGSLKKLLRTKASATGKALSNPPDHPMFSRRTVDRENQIRIVKASLNNLKNLSVDIPLGLFVAVSGVSGSGKSTLIREILVENLNSLVGRHNRRKKRQYSGCKELTGWEGLDRILEVDQTPIGKTPRSCPATYVGIWNDIRNLFANTTEARMRGYTAARFSFNAADGRCDVCDGQGMRRISMSFLADVSIVCERCNGDRFSADTLEVLYKDKNIAEVLHMSIDDAVEFFSAHPRIHHAVTLLSDVGLSYLTLGQPSPTLSGGEAQRLKLVTELAKGRNAGNALIVLDEPTIGLHIADVEKLLGVIDRLVARGHSVLVIEHNLDVLAEADWLIDMGPEGGAAGGRVVARGVPESLVKRKRSTHTSSALAEFLNRH